MSAVLERAAPAATAPAEDAGRAPAAANERLSGDAIFGARATGVAQLARVLIGVLSLALLAALLPESDFGLAGMAAIVVGFVVTFKDLGTGVAVVQRKVLDEATLASLFWLNCGIGLLATLLLLAATPLVSACFAEPRLATLLPMLAVGLTLSGPGVVPQALLQRRLRFRELARIEIGSQLAGAAGACVLAALGAGAHSLIAQALIASGVATTACLLVARYRPALVFSRASLAGVASLSGPLVGFQLFNYFARNADQALIGRIAGAAALGPYSLALRLVMQPLGSIGQVAQRVLLPVYARMQDDKERLRAAHLRVTGAVATIVFPFLALAIALAEPLVRGAFAERWGDVAPLVSLLGAVGFVQVLTSSTAVVYQALRRTDLMFFWGVGSGSAVVSAFWIGSQRGAVGVAFAYLLASLALAYPGMRLPLALIDLRPARLLRAVAFPAVLALSIAALCRLADCALGASLPPLARFATLAAAGLTAYAVGIAALDRGHARDVAKLLRGQVE